jgi:hypothetical protein
VVGLASDRRTFASATTPAEIIEVLENLLFPAPFLFESFGDIPADRRDQVAAEILRNLAGVVQRRTHSGDTHEG